MFVILSFCRNDCHREKRPVFMLGRIGTEKPYLYKTTNLWCIYVIELINNIIAESDNSKALIVLSGVCRQNSKQMYCSRCVE